MGHGRYLASKKYKTKRFKRELDQVLNDDMKSDKRIHALENQAFDEYTPGLAQHYCIPCAHYYETDFALKSHLKGKVHKRRLKELKFGPYTAEEAAAGAGRDVQKYLDKAQLQKLIMKSGRAEELLTRQKPEVVSESMDVEVQVEVEETNSPKESLDDIVC